MDRHDHVHSPTHGPVSFARMVTELLSFVQVQSDCQYRLIIGTDSLPNGNGQVYLVTAVVLHRVGNGGIYFWQRELSKPMHTLRERMYAEALQSIRMAQELGATKDIAAMLPSQIEIHVDVGEDGPTRDMIQELMGMIVAHGFTAKTKPDSFAASKVADRHTVPGPKELIPVYS